MKSKEAPARRTRATSQERPEDLFRVLLHDDDVHAMDYVADCLARVFHFSAEEAWAVMSEAHCTGVALCCIESRTPAERRRDALRSFGLSSTLERDG